MFEKVSRLLKYDSNLFCPKKIYIYYMPPPLTVHFPMMHSVRYQPIFNGLKFMLQCARILNNIVITTVIWYVIRNLLHFVIVKYGVISLVLCISTRLRLVTILTLLVKYLVIFHADPCNKSYSSGQNKVPVFTL